LVFPGLPLFTVSVEMEMNWTTPSVPLVKSVPNPPDSASKDTKAAPHVKVPAVAIKAIRAYDFSISGQSANLVDGLRVSNQDAVTLTHKQPDK
jgi:hypothetical protein